MAATVVVLPSSSSDARDALTRELRTLDQRVVEIDVDLSSADPAPLSVRVCAAIITARPAAPLLLVALADAVHLLPAVALAQRTAHRAVTGYVLIEPDSDPSAPDWPDAPVLVLSADAKSSGATRARLRGWSMNIARSPVDVAAAIVDYMQ
jgi:hypothetical protein